MQFNFPGYSITQVVGSNRIRYNMPRRVSECIVTEENTGNFPIFRLTDTEGNDYFILKSKVSKLKLIGYENVILCEDFDLQQAENSGNSWIKFTPHDMNLYREQVRENWNNLKSEININKLREPQIGAFCGVVAHNTVSNSIGTIIMPTGTGKTEVMLTINCYLNPKNLLVIVPTSSLRKQISEKFVNNGILHNYGILPENFQSPTVGIVEHGFKTIDDINSFIQSTNVAVATMSVVSSMNADIQKYFSSKFDMLFIDEAHHVGAITWKKFKQGFKGKPTFQFTATPFREDGEIVEGKVLYDYPLAKAQENGYFKPLNFIPIIKVNNNEADGEIAKMATDKLSEDIRVGKDHILMVRCKDIAHATHIYETYYSQYAQYNPILIHSKLKKSELNMLLFDLKERRSRLVVCVEMLGEGYDLPALKIAAFHFIPKSLGITLQLIGRFTRSGGENIGDATIIANILDSDFQAGIKELYSHDSDWNKIIPNLSSQAIRKQRKLLDFIHQLDIPEDFDMSIENINLPYSGFFIKSSIINWNEETVNSCLRKNFDINSIWHLEDQNAKILIIIDKNFTYPEFGKFQELEEVRYSIHIIKYDNERGMFYVLTDSPNTAKNLITHFSNEYSLISGQEVFRVFFNINRLQLSTVGLKDTLSKGRSYVMHAGIDVQRAITSAEQTSKVKTNLFGYGFESGQSVQIGSSTKGKVWAKKRGNIVEWFEWAIATSVKLQNPRADLVSTILPNTLKPLVIEERPVLHPIGIDIHEELYALNKTGLYIRSGGGSNYILEDVSFNIVNFEKTGNLSFKISSDSFEAIYSLNLLENNKFSFTQTSGSDLIVLGLGDNRVDVSMVDFLSEYPPTLYFSNGSMLYDGNIFVESNYTEGGEFDLSLIKTCDWSSVTLTSESQGIGPDNINTESVQHKIIKDLKEGQEDYDIVFNDDGKGEIADILAIKIIEETQEIELNLYHCKWSHSEVPGARLNDMYEVCGQAQKSIRWCNLHKTIARLISRGNKNEGRFEKGNMESLLRLKSIYERFVIKYRLLPRRK